MTDGNIAIFHRQLELHLCIRRNVMTGNLYIQSGNYSLSI